MENPVEFEFSSFSFLLFLRAGIYLCVRWERERVVSSGRNKERESVVDSVGGWRKIWLLVLGLFFQFLSLFSLTTSLMWFIHFSSGFSHTFYA